MIFLDSLEPFHGSHPSSIHLNESRQTVYLQREVDYKKCSDVLKLLVGASFGNTFLTLDARGAIEA